MNNTTLNHAADGAREVEVTPDGTVREVPPVDSPTTPVPPTKSTKLSPHTFGER